MHNCFGRQIVRHAGRFFDGLNVIAIAPHRHLLAAVRAHLRSAIDGVVDIHAGKAPAMTLTDER